MCGIAGIVGAADPVATVAAMTAALAHRGPDDSGLQVWGDWAAALGHRRLAIIDLSAAGRQPMASTDGRYWIAYNGEIYNHRELRGELAARGHAFRTLTDTEVLLAAFAEWGEACLTHLRGMFAFAVVDARERTVFLARDRFGIKPLYYVERPGCFAFASELRAFLASGLVERRVDRQAVWDYLSLGAVAQPRTILSGVTALMPGQAAMVGHDGVMVRRWQWWNLVSAAQRDFPAAGALDWEDACAGLREQLDLATRYHLVADVPVGAFLSGGVDSAAMVGLMGRHVEAPIRTFTIGFEPEHRDLDEAHPAAETARHFGTRHTAVTITDAEVEDGFGEMLRATDQPSADGFNTYLVARTASRDVKVALSGLGGDELFAGYTHFRRHAAAAALRRRLPFLGWLAPLADCFPDRLRHNLLLPVLSERDRLATLRCLMYEQRKHRVIHPEFKAGWRPQPLERLCAPVGGDLDPVSALSAFELQGYLARTLLRDADAMSMAHGLELRPLLLDHRLAEFALMLAGAHKLKNGRRKAVFLAALADILPDTIVARPKHGFQLPLMRWLTGRLADRACSALSSDVAATLLTVDYRRQACERLHGSRGPAGTRQFDLWAVVVLLCWFEENAVAL